MTRLPFLAVVCSLLVQAGCAHYQLGTGGRPKFSTIFVAPITSEALLPQWRTVVNTQLREAFIRDGRVALTDTAETADAVLEVHLTAYDRTPIVGRPQDTAIARRFDLRLRAQATLTDRRTGRDYFSRRPLLAERGAFADGGLVQAEYQTLPLLAASLAEHALHAALDTW